MYNKLLNNSQWQKGYSFRYNCDKFKIVEFMFKLYFDKRAQLSNEGIPNNIENA